MANLGSTEKTRIRRAPTRAVKEEAMLYEIIDHSYVSHVGFVDRGSPIVIPTLGWRDGETVFFHGSRGSRMLNVFKDGGEACLTFTLLDGLVMARSAFHHSANYRSAVIFGKPTLIESRQEKLDTLKVFMDNIAPGRWETLRETNDQEIEATDVLALPMDEASVKVRTGDPIDDEEDLNHPVWAGIIPIERSFGPTIDAADNLDSQKAPDFSSVFANYLTS
ncbi:MAG: pyridoxamine 5'-phosphate oxidase family protein [Proteobacteria bacterium]|nr:pyridoxamine 5'-phosphate oxidase family protein [Pseudomonadota bacterium]